MMRRAVGGRATTVAIRAVLVASALACALGVAAHSKQTTCDVRGTGASLPAEKRDSITVSLDGNSPDADWAPVARLVAGGFAGLYVEHPDSVPADVPRVDGHPVRQCTVVRLVHSEQKLEALRALRGPLGTRHLWEVST
jgi:hypothetical protein